MATFYQKPITINFWVNNYSIKARVLFGKNIIFCSNPKVNNLWTTYFDMLNPLANMLLYGKHKIFMTYYPSHKTTYSTKSMGIILIFP